MKRVMAQVVKEVAQFRRDRLTVALAFVLPVLAILMYGFGTRLESKNIKVAVFNLDNGALSREYIDTIFATDQFVAEKWQGKDAMGPLDLGVAKASVTIPPEFSRKVKQGLGAQVQVIIDATDVNNARVIKNSMIATTQYFMRSHHLTNEKRLIDTDLRLWFNPGRDEAIYVSPGAMAVMLWIFPCLLAALAMSREKEQGTILQLYTSSISARELIAGKTLAYVLIGIVQSALVTAVSMFFFHIRFKGDFLTFAVSLVLFLSCSVLFGMFASSRTNNQSAAVQIVATTGFTTALLLSGFLYPLRNIVYPLSLVSNILPARYFVEACRNMFVRGSDAAGQVHIPIALTLIAFLLFNAASGVMKKMQLKG